MSRPPLVCRFSRLTSGTCTSPDDCQLSKSRSRDSGGTLTHTHTHTATYSHTYTHSHNTHTLTHTCTPTHAGCLFCLVLRLIQLRRKKSQQLQSKTEKRKIFCTVCWQTKAQAAAAAAAYEKWAGQGRTWQQRICHTKQDMKAWQQQRRAVKESQEEEKEAEPKRRRRRRNWGRSSKEEREKYWWWWWGEGRRWWWMKFTHSKKFHLFRKHELRQRLRGSWAH